MKTTLFVIAGFLCATPSFADTTLNANMTLVLENDAGMVTQVTDMTQRECEAVVLLLSARKTGDTGITITSGFVGYGTTTMPDRKAATSKLTSQKCVLPASK